MNQNYAARLGLQGLYVQLCNLPTVHMCLSSILTKILGAAPMLPSSHIRAPTRTAGQGVTYFIVIRVAVFHTELCILTRLSSTFLPLGEGSLIFPFFFVFFFVFVVSLSNENAELRR